MTIKERRNDFPLLLKNNTIYLDNAATSQKPVAVIKAEQDFYERSNANPLRGFYPLSVEATAVYENARVTVQQFLHAASEKEIIFTRNTTESINLVAYSYALSKLTKGDELVVSIMEHHSNMLPWQMVAQRTGATLRYLDCEPDGSILPETYESVIGEKTKLVAITQVSNVLGRENPIKEIAALAHKNGAVIVVDAALWKRSIIRGNAAVFNRRRNDRFCDERRCGLCRASAQI